MKQTRLTFKDNNLQRQFEKDGFVIVPFFSKEQVSAILNVAHSLDSGIYDGFYNSIYSPDKDYRKKVNEVLTKQYESTNEKHLVNYKLLAAAFAVKFPGKNSELVAHQDWNLVDEENFTSVNCFIPLTEMTEENGCIKIMKGSHRLFKDILRGSPSFPTPINNLQKEIVEKYLTTPKIQIGEALIHNHALVHYSGANLTKTSRIAAIINMIPEEINPIHYHRSEDKIECFEVDESFYKTIIIGEKPNAPVKFTINDYAVKKLEPKDLAEFYQKEYGYEPKKPSFWDRFKF